VIDTATNTVVTSVPVPTPGGIAITPNGAFAYVTSQGSLRVSVINTATNGVFTSFGVAPSSYGVAITPDGAFAYVANGSSAGAVAVINTATNTVVATVPVGAFPTAVAITPAANGGSDATPPQVSCGASDGAWHRSDVTIACAASDPESGLANAADASFNLTTNVPIGTETPNAATTSRSVCNTVGGCTTAGPIFRNQVDKKSPTITITSPAANATYQLKASVSASYACVDGGSGVAACQGPVANASPIDTSSKGTKTFTVTSTDNVGNPSTLTSTYSVVAGGGGGQTPADVGITLSAPGKVSPGATLTYSMNVTNAGQVTATGVVVSNTLPPGTGFASVSASQGTVTTAPTVGKNGTVGVAVGSLANGATVTISVVVTVTAAPGTMFTDSATVTATQDSNSRNNSATVKTTVSKN